MTAGWASAGAGEVWRGLVVENPSDHDAVDPTWLVRRIHRVVTTSGCA
jgi:hypothetical protein